MRSRYFIASVVCVVVVLALGIVTGVLIGGRGAEQEGSASEASNPLTYAVTGRLMVYGAFGTTDGSECDYAVNRMNCVMKGLRFGEKLLSGKEFAWPDGPGGGYSDLHDGAQIVVRDADGSVLGSGSLANGTLSVDGVAFQFRVDGLPKSDIYQVTIGSRPPMVTSFDELVSQNWRLPVTIGS